MLVPCPIHATTVLEAEHKSRDPAPPSCLPLGKEEAQRVCRSLVTVGVLRPASLHPRASCAYKRGSIIYMCEQTQPAQNVL